jgi:hypothetical protein
MVVLSLDDDLRSVRAVASLLPVRDYYCNDRNRSRPLVCQHMDRFHFTPENKIGLIQVSV